MKNLKTILILVLAGGLGYLAYYLATKPRGVHMSTEALSDFAVKDTATIDKLVLTDTEGNPGVTLVRNGTTWVDGNQDCIQQHLVHTILETIKYIKVKSPLADGSIETINKNLAAHHVKMEIYQSGKLLKTWYIGDPTQDQYGTFMLLKDEKKGKSPVPFIMHLPNMYGNLSTRFITDPRAFECTDVFLYDPLNIASVDVTIPDSSQFNYKIVATSENSFELFSNGQEVNDFDTTFVRGYLVDFKKIHFENHNYTLSEENIDSLKKSVPFYVIKVTDKQGGENQIRIFKRKYLIEKYGLDGNLLEYDQDRVWVEMNDGRVVVGQYYVFGKLMRTVDFFKGPPNQ